MPFQISPGVSVSEIDLTTVVPSVATSVGAFAGIFNWGPVNEVVTISDELRLVDRFGKPTSENYEHWFSAANFLAYSNNLKVVRAAGTETKNAIAGDGANSAVLIANLTDYEQNFSSGANTYGTFAAKYAGDLGNSIRVELCDNSEDYNNWGYKAFFVDEPSTSDFVTNKGGADDELHVVIVDSLGKITGTANTILETYAFLSKAVDAKREDGSSNYYANVLNRLSKYVYWMSHPEGAVDWGVEASGTEYGVLSDIHIAEFTGGANGAPTTGSLQTAFGFFKNAENVDVSLIITGPSNSTVTLDVIQNVAEKRKDCVVFVSPEKDDVVNNPGGEVDAILAFRNTLGSSSYAFMDSGWKYQYDKYNDTYRWIPLNGDIAGLCARTDKDRDPWFSPSGLNRGLIKNTVKLAWNPNAADRDNLYIKGVNPVVTFQGEGTILYGDKTLLAKPSAFDRLNVRRLFIVIEKSIAKAARYSLFEFNDQFTRAQFVNLIEPYLRDVQGRRGIFDFRVVCDETNNTGEVIDRNEFIGDIYIKPARSINFIQLNFVAVRTGVSFDEIVGRF
jgi:phage tail sheath protein FI